MRPPRTTIRRLMAIVLFIAVATWAGVAAERTRSNRARFHAHFHANGVPHDWNGEFTVTPEWVGFWPVYWRTLFGLPWDWRYVCVPGDGHREVACEHDFPKLSVPEVELLQAVFDGRPIHLTDRRTGGAAPLHR
jgi:hypothetical protein